MIMEDSNYEYWNLVYWEGFRCICGNVELNTYTEDEYREKQRKVGQIYKYDYMNYCPHCNHDLIEDIGSESFKCKNYKCGRVYTVEELYKIKTGGLKLP